MPRSTNAGKLATWRARFELFDSGNQTIAEFCRRESDSVATFHYWRRRVGGAVRRSKSSAALQPVRLLGPPDAIRFTLRCGARIEISSSNREALREVIGALMAVESGASTSC